MLSGSVCRLYFSKKMNENEYLAKTVNAQLEAGRPIVVVSIMGISGSTSRHGGTKMVVGADGKSHGTIGGSLIEAAAVSEAKKILATAKSKVLAYELTGKDVTASGMICGGKAEILLDYLAATKENLEFSRQWRDAIKRGKDFYLLTYIRGKNNALEITGHAILDADGSPLSPTPTVPEIVKLKSELHNISATAVLFLDEGRVMVDRIRKIKTLYCFGAGHVAVPTAHLAAIVGFRAVVTDDRAEYANAERFPEASEIRVIRDYTKAFDGLEIDEDSFIVIVTRGHQYDREVLESSLKTKAGYIGMISSRKKRQAIYEYLMARGVKKERLEQVHSPIGINIGGETPEEIAVSIVAEMIKVRGEQAA
jgi:xanthine dehydrogenase accessory factor